MFFPKQNNTDEMKSLKNQVKMLKEQLQKKTVEAHECKQQLMAFTKKDESITTNIAELKPEKRCLEQNGHDQAKEGSRVGSNKILEPG